MTFLFRLDGFPLVFCIFFMKEQSYGCSFLLRKNLKGVVVVTIKEQIFCDELLSDTEFNKTLAYKKAYPSVKNDNVAAAAASRLMNKSEIKEYIEKQLAELHNEKTAEAQEVLEYLTSVMRREHKENVVVTLSKETSTYVPDEKGTMRKQTVKEEIPQIVEIPTRVSDANKAAELLGKRYGLYTDKLDVNNEAEEKKAEKLDNIASILEQIKPVREGD